MFCTLPYIEYAAIFHFIRLLHCSKASNTRVERVNRRHEKGRKNKEEEDGDKDETGKKSKTY